MKKKYRYLHQFDGVWELSDPPSYPCEIDYKPVEQEFDTIINFNDMKKIIDNVKVHNPSLKDEDFCVCRSNTNRDELILAYTVEVVKSEQQYKDEFNQYKLDMEAYNEEKALLPSLIKESLEEKQRVVVKLKELAKTLGI